MPKHFEGVETARWDIVSGDDRQTVVVQMQMNAQVGR